MKKFIGSRVGIVIVLLSFSSPAVDFTGPGDWRTVDTNGVKAWQCAQKETPSLRVWKGVVADKKKREVRLLAEAVGHAAGVTTEFALVGPLSDRAYEAAAISIALPGDIVRATEAIGIQRGGCIGSRLFRFWPCGERFQVLFRFLRENEKETHPFGDLFLDKEKETPMLGAEGVVFTGGKWEGEKCVTDTNMPSSVLSLYNEAETVFDVPFQVGQSEVYGRLVLGKKLPCGELLEVILRPLLPQDGNPRVLPIDITFSPSKEGIVSKIQEKGKTVKALLPLHEALTFLRERMKEGREPFVTLDMDDSLSLHQATEIATVFSMLDGKGVKMDGKAERGVYYRSFLPREKWRERKDRVPQPFELHLTRDVDGKIGKTLTFIEEDWSGEGLDPKLTPKDYSFLTWNEFLPLVQKAGGADNKVNLLFIFAPADMQLAEIMPAVRSTTSRFSLLYFFAE